MLDHFSAGVTDNLRCNLDYAIGQAATEQLSEAELHAVRDALDASTKKAVTHHIFDEYRHSMSAGNVQSYASQLGINAQQIEGVGQQAAEGNQFVEKVKRRAQQFAQSDFAKGKNLPGQVFYSAVAITVAIGAVRTVEALAEKLYSDKSRNIPQR